MKKYFLYAIGAVLAVSVLNKVLDDEASKAIIVKYLSYIVVGGVLYLLRGYVKGIVSSAIHFAGRVFSFAISLGVAGLIAGGLFLFSCRAGVDPLGAAIISLIGLGFIRALWGKTRGRATSPNFGERI